MFIAQYNELNGSFLFFFVVCLSDVIFLISIVTHTLMIDQTIKQSISQLIQSIEMINRLFFFFLSFFFGRGGWERRGRYSILISLFISAPPHRETNRTNEKLETRKYFNFVLVRQFSKWTKKKQIPRRKKIALFFLTI